MEQQRPVVMSFAGLDPSGGAGLLADIKTFEQHRVYGLGICTALTIQTASDFISVDWLSLPRILAQARPLLATEQVNYCKIGIMADVQALQELVYTIKYLSPGIRIILDPVLKASAGHAFHNNIPRQAWLELLPELYLLTPNYPEARLLTGLEDGEAAAQQLATRCAVLLKGGHHKERPGVDTLYAGGKLQRFPAGTQTTFPKHGSGCVLSAAITANLASGQSLPDACANAKAYTENVLSSHSSLTGYHHI
ncbi:hydroxymethylpyrimidine/phosphomethylpyrimidine kinase [Chitinophaga qingshengii]|uniref:hydroxymethylpyrimidine kinase n=1 Tax=Chitinophaga qingshengii TaxID=1569794 RepID=A0ABR7TQ39_9BACT|nr:hydroxymethylpyrimidine/phosphomethylpyrimidine kinase [Chitinophaga qingshengii]MBC9931544.1 hydroxymethylpyrimidine/phosphomethylpyrimidine kinase [Chitinophaga qingshengii]